MPKAELHHSRSFRRVARSSSNGLVESSASKPQRKRRSNKFALTLEAPPDVVSSEIRAALAFVGRCLLGAGGVAAGLISLLYVTSFFESLMHTTTDLVCGRSLKVAAATGVAVGTLHTVAGPDHFAGLAPMVVGQRRSPLAAFGLGALWGSGHATGQLIIGIACLAVHLGLLRVAWGPTMSYLSGFLVGASLIAIGCLGLVEARRFVEAEDSGQEADTRPRFGWTTYATGVLHGLSPDAIIFVAPALALPRLAAVLHVFGVVAGTLLSMGTCTAMLSALCSRSPRLKLISNGASMVSIALGACIIAASFGVSVPLPGL